MRYLKGQEEKEAIEFIDKTAHLALKSTCQRDRCGSLIVNNGGIIGCGFNSPPGNMETQRRCLRKHELHPDFKTDKTCCIHAEIRAIIDALARNPKKIVGSRLYFIRLDNNGNKTHAGKPYCTYCSKMSLDVGIKEFILWHKEGVCVYDTKEYNDISFQFRPN